VINESELVDVLFEFLVCFNLFILDEEVLSFVVKYVELFLTLPFISFIEIFDPLDPLDSLSSFLEQEMMVRLKRKRERIMSICFTWFPIGGFRITQYITSIGLFYKNVGILLGGCLTL